MELEQILDAARNDIVNSQNKGLSYEETLASALEYAVWYDGDKSIAEIEIGKVFDEYFETISN